MVIFCVANPAGLDADKVKTVVPDTKTVVDANPVTLIPDIWVDEVKNIVGAGEPVTTQENTTGCPAVSFGMVVGLAVNDEITGAVAAGVVTRTGFDWADVFPAASKALTE